jgi:hypothetical protein
MSTVVFNRRHLLAAGGSVVAAGMSGLGISGLIVPARAQSVAPTSSMSGGSNNYIKGAKIVDKIGKGGFIMSGTVRRAGDGAPLAGQRIQIWAHTTEGREEDERPWRHADRQGRHVPSGDAADHSDLRPAAWSPRL